jgi:hypothetical protein
VTTEEFTYEQRKESRMANNRQHAKSVSCPCFRYHGMKVYSEVPVKFRALSLQDMVVNGQLLRQ